MPLPVISGVRRCSIIGSMGAQEIVNVVHVVGGSSDADASDDVGAAWTAMMAEHGVISSDYTAHSINVLLLDGSSATSSFIPAGWSLAGSNVGASVPAQVAMIFTLRTALGGRSRRGRRQAACRTFRTWLMPSPQLSGPAPTDASSWLRRTHSPRVQASLPP